MATWPATLPSPQTSGYGLEPVDPVMRTGMEIGATRARRISAARNDRINVTWDMTDAQMNIFRAWFENDAEAAHGAAWFYVTLADGYGGLNSVEAKFAGIYRATVFNVLDWRVTATLEVRDA